MTWCGCTSSQTIINNYRLGSKLGAGSYGSVHVCEDINNGKKFALKIVDKTKLRKRRLGQSDEELLREVGSYLRLFAFTVATVLWVTSRGWSGGLRLKSYCIGMSWV